MRCLSLASVSQAASSTGLTHAKIASLRESTQPCKLGLRYRSFTPATREQPPLHAVDAAALPTAITECSLLVLHHWAALLLVRLNVAFAALLAMR